MLTDAKKWADQHPDFVGVLTLKKEKPCGKGGWKTKLASYDFVISPTGIFRQSYGLHRNGICQCCGAVHREPSFFWTWAVEGWRMNVGAHVCAKCHEVFSIPRVQPIPRAECVI